MQYRILPHVFGNVARARHDDALRFSHAGNDVIHRVCELVRRQLYLAKQMSVPQNDRYMSPADQRPVA